MKLYHANKQIDDLNSEKEVLKSYVADVNLYFQTLRETCDSLIMVSVRQHLVEKLKLVFSMLNCIERVSEHDAIRKQRREAKKTSSEEPKNTVGDFGKRSIKRGKAQNKKNVTKSLMRFSVLAKKLKLVKRKLMRKPQYQTWSSKKIAIVKVFRPDETESFINVRFKAVRGARSSVFEFTFVDLPCLNPYEWIYLFTHLSKDKQKFEPIVAHLKRMLVSYIQEIGKTDVEIATMLRKKPIVQP
ncbi:unnamed protein product [Lactuca saligna]|uniref:Uncharacterized protein n=1 Tax=Lactuca saligna TaxID=75948 RepID=A0AA35VGW8_LACSI|nr:unnamed protein product [Lactuca saligna]